MWNGDTESDFEIIGGYWIPVEDIADALITITPNDFKKLFLTNREEPVKLPRKGSITYIPQLILRIP